MWPQIGLFRSHGLSTSRYDRHGHEISVELQSTLNTICTKNLRVNYAKSKCRESKYRGGLLSDQIWLYHHVATSIIFHVTAPLLISGALFTLRLNRMVLHHTSGLCRTIHKFIYLPSEC